MPMKEGVSRNKDLDSRFAQERLAGLMNATPEPAELRSLAAAVINRAFDDLRTGCRDDREDAETFLRASGWTGETPWMRASGLDRQTVIAKVEQINAERERVRNMDVERNEFARAAFGGVR